MCDEELVEASQNTIEDSFVKLSEKARKIVCDYVRQDVFLSVAKATSFLGLDSEEEAQSLLAEMPEETRKKVGGLCQFDMYDAEVIDTVREVLESSGETFAAEKKAIADNSFSCGSDFWAETVKPFIQDNPLFEELEFKFSDIKHLTDRAVQKVLREIDTTDLAIALKNADEETENKFFGNMSERAAEMLKEDIKRLDLVTVKQEADSQNKILKIIKRLENTGDIFFQ